MSFEWNQISHELSQIATRTEQVAALSTPSPHPLGRRGPPSQQVCCFKCKRVEHTLRECQSRQGTKENLRTLHVAKLDI